MTLPVGQRVRVHHQHWLMPGVSGEVVAHKPVVSAVKRNEVRLDKQWVPSADPERCRRMYFADEELTVIG